MELIGYLCHAEWGLHDRKPCVSFVPKVHSALVTKQMTFPSHVPLGLGKSLSCQNSFSVYILIPFFMRCND